MSELPAEADVVIVGAGPAGLSAATELRRAGVARVLVLERERVAGGIPRHCAHSPYGLREFGRPMFGPAYARALAARARSAGADIRTGVSVCALLPGPRLSVTADASGPAEIAARAVLLATGARESSRIERGIGGTKPGGVLSTGALQGLVHLAGARPFRRPVILGTELVSFSALLTCLGHGIRPVAMAEPGPAAVARWPAALLPRLLGIPLLLGCRIEAVEGGARVTGVRLAGGARRLECDGLVVSGAFRPETALLAPSHLALDPGTGGPAVDSLGRLSDPDYFAAGNLLRPVETAGHCWAEGRRVARAICAHLAGRLPPHEAGTPVAREGAALAWVMPQRVAAGDWQAFDRLALRAARPARGRLSLRLAGQEIAGRDRAIRPERRLWLPLPRAGRGPVTVAFAEDAS